jgi:biopolymer transport protein TolR
MTVGVPVDLPKTTAQPLNQESEPLTITVNTEGKIFLQETEVPLDGLVPRLQAIMREQPQGAPERRIFVRGDKAISYGRVMEVMGTIAGAGFTRVALLAEQQQAPRLRQRRLAALLRPRRARRHPRLRPIAQPSRPARGWGRREPCPGPCPISV